MKSVAVIFVAAMLLAGLFFSLLSSGFLANARKVTSNAVSATVDIELYADSACTQTLTTIDWGLVSAGQAVTRTFYIMNLGKFPVTLSLTATNWVPGEANGPVKLTWNREGTKLFANRVMMATLTLTLSSELNGIAAFGMDTVISGTK